jgi:excisionase family DNA binding protein
MVRNDKTEAILGVSPRTLMSEREVTVYLRASVRTIINWRQRGLIPYFRIGRSIRYSREQIDRALMERHQRNAGALSTS